jgi:hypothetical protein
MFRGSMALLAGAALALAASQGAAAAEPGARTVAKKMERAERVEGAHGPRVFVMRHGEDRAERLKNLLQLRPGQEPALKAYLEAVEPQRDHLAAVERTLETRKATPERLAEMETRLDGHHAAAKARIAATRAFYAQLDERQKRAFDELPLMMMGPGLGPMPMGPALMVRRLPDGGFEMPPPPDL